MSQEPHPTSSVPQHHGLLDKVRDAFSPSRARTSRDSSNERQGDASVAEEEGRGRKPKESQRHLISTGRGGAGNMMRSPSRDPSEIAAEHRQELDLERSISRSRSGERNTSRVRMGRGGAGNIRSPSREPQSKIDADKAFEAKVIKDQLAREEGHKHSYGRGGAGNIKQGGGFEGTQIADDEVPV